MPNTKFFTKKGDKGTSLLGKCEIPKDDAFFHLLGGLDELNSWLGLARASVNGSRKLRGISDQISDIQEELFVAQAEVAALGMGLKPKIKISAGHIKKLEDIIGLIDADLPPLIKFIIPGATEPSAFLDLARTMARKVERAAKTYSKEKKLSPDFMKFSNRLSSVLFALARYVNYRLGVKEEHPKYK